MDLRISHGPHTPLVSTIFATFWKPRSKGMLGRMLHVGGWYYLVGGKLSAIIPFELAFLSPLHGGVIKPGLYLHGVNKTPA